MIKLSKRMTDDILRLTETKPEQLLEWFVGLPRDEAFPCTLSPYMNKFSFLANEIKKSYLDIDMFLVNEIEKSYLDIDMYVYVKCRNGLSIYCIWEYARESDEHMAEVVAWFKKAYKIQDRGNK